MVYNQIVNLKLMVHGKYGYELGFADIKVVDRIGEEHSMSAKYRGKEDPFSGLIRLPAGLVYTTHLQFGKATQVGLKALRFLDSPCNQFGRRAPGTAKRFMNFVNSRDFPQFAETRVNGARRHVLFTVPKSDTERRSSRQN